jgi:hypothetical protein
MLLRGLALFGEEGDAWGQAALLNALGNVALAGGGAPEAATLYEGSAALCRSAGLRWNLAWALSGLAGACLLTGRLHDAGTACRESLVLSRDLGNTDGLTMGLDGMAAIMAAQGQTERAALLFGAAGALMTPSSPVGASGRYVFHRYRIQVQERLSEPG